jgi:outer membrane protein, multidrug efflux system
MVIERGVQETIRNRGMRPELSAKASPKYSAHHALLSCLALIALVFPACKMGPDYTRPETEKVESWRLTRADAESMANLPWWELLKDEALQQLIRTSLVENLDLQIATANIEDFRAQLMAAKFDLVPSFNYSGTAFGLRNTNNNVLPIGGGAVPVPSSGDGLSLAYESAEIGLKWEVDLWGRIRRSIEAAKAQLLSQYENQRAVVIGLVSNVAEAYFDLRGLDFEVEIAKRTLNAWDESVRLSELRYRHGTIPKLDLDRFRAERAGMAAHLADMERQVVQTENRLSILLGHRPADVMRGARLTDQSIPPAVPPGLPSALLERRPDILKAEQDLVASTAVIGVAQAERFPQLALTGAVSGAGFQVNGSSVGPFAIFKGSASLAGPLLNASALGFQLRSREALAQAAEVQYRKVVLTAFKEVEDALIAVQKAGEQRVAQEQQVEALQSAFGLADARYQGGRASYLDVLTAQRSLFEAELGLARTRRGQLTSMVQLYKALGGGWSPSNSQQLAQETLRTSQ